MFLLSTSALSQSGATQGSTPSDAGPKDDILILANVTAKELKFEAVPSPKVEFPGTQKRATVWVTDRFNLPDEVQPGVTYRNIGITLKISSRFEDIEQIVREALGEEPAPGAGAIADNAIAPSDIPVSVAKKVAKKKGSQN